MRNETTTHHDFGVTDAKGRAIGARVTISFLEAWTNPGDEAHRWHAPSRAACYRFAPFATRNGAPFGAIPVQSWRNFDTLEAALAHAAAYLEGARKRAAKAAAER